MPSMYYVCSGQRQCLTEGPCADKPLVSLVYLICFPGLVGLTLQTSPRPEADQGVPGMLQTGQAPPLPTWTGCMESTEGGGAAPAPSHTTGTFRLSRGGESALQEYSCAFNRLV